MRVAILTCSLSLLPTACVDDPDDPGPGPDPVMEEPAARIAVDTLAAPSLIAYRDGDGPWRTPTATSATAFELEVRGPYRVTAVCDDGRGSVFAWQVARTPDDERRIELPCSPGASEFRVAGQMAQPGRVYIDGALALSISPDWNFSLEARPGTRDLIATTADRIAIRRGIEVKLSGTAPLVFLGPLDLAVEGQDLVPVAFTAPNATPSEVMNATVLLDAGSTRASIYRGPAASARVAPGDALAATDVQTAIVSARDTASRRTVTRPFRAGDPTAFELPAPIGPVAFDAAGGQLTASWTTLPEHDLLDLALTAISSDGEKFLAHDLEVSPRYLAATGASSATIETADIPGFRPEWQIDTTAEHDRALLAVKLSPAGTASSGAFESYGTAARESSRLTDIPRHLRR